MNARAAQLALIGLSVFALFGLAGCIGEGNAPIVGPSGPGASTISGLAFKGPFSGGTARVRTLTPTGGPGTELGTASVASDARFQVSIVGHTGPVHITVEGGAYTDEVAGAQNQTTGLTAVLPSASGSPSVVVTPLTHMAAAITQRDMAVNATPAVDAINAANAVVAGYYKITSMLTTEPEILSAGPAVAGNAANYGALLAAISQQAAGLGVASDVLAGLLGRDASDGMFDGLESGVAIPAGAGNLPADAGRAAMGAALTTFLGTGANTSTLVAADFNAMLTRLAAVPSTLLFIESIAVTPANKTIAQAMRVTYIATATMSDGTTPNVTATANWLSSDTGIAQIVGVSAAQAGANAGPTTISATVGTVTGQTGLTVGVFSLSSIAVTPLTPTIAPGKTQQFTATATYSDASTANISDIVDWQSSAANVLTINTQGLATTVAVGTATVTATELGTATTDGTLVTVTVRYSADIQPLLNANCITCHSGPGAPLGLRLTNYVFLMNGSQNGPVVIAGDPNNSEIIKRLEGTKLPRMPNEAPPLPQSTIDLVRTWIALGALNN